MDLLAITAQLSVVNGTILDEGPVSGLLAQPAPPKPARGRERDFLFIHLTLSGPSDETDELNHELVDDLTRRFFAASGSVTSALRRAVIETNDQLLRHNISVKTPREGALSCAVLHNDELYTLQVGEGLTFLGHNFGVERMPARLPQQITPLGRTAGIDIRFAYHRLQPGDMMLMCEPRLSRLTGDELAPVLVDTEIESGLESLITILATDSARLLLVEFADELPSTLPLTFQHSKQSAPKPATTKPPSGQAKNKSEPAGQKTASPVPSRQVPVTGQQVEGMTPPETANDGPADFETSARRVASSSARRLSRFTGWLAEILTRLTKKSDDEPAIHWAIPATVALIVPLIVGAIITSVYLQRDTVAEVAAIKQQMMDELSAADNVAGNTGEAQSHYLKVIALAAKVEEMRPEDQEVANMRSEAFSALDQIDGVSRLSAVSYFSYAPGANLTRITLRRSGGGIAVLDQVQNRVLFHQTDDTFEDLTTEEPITIGFGGQVVGANTIGRIFDILWMAGSASETRDSIGMVDTSGGLFHFYPNLADTSGVILGNSSAWINPVSMATYLDRLYVLDSGAKQIWKYYTSTGYTQLAGDEAISFSDEADLDLAVDFDLYAEDGSLIVLYGDGRIRYYDTRSGRVQWDQSTLAQNGLATPLIAPSRVKIVGTGLNASIYVLDPGSGRLVQLSRGGTVLTQYRIMDDAGNDILTRASDFDVVDSPMRVFVVANERIYLAERN